jgi:hypothetical protein
MDGGIAPLSLPGLPITMDFENEGLNKSLPQMSKEIAITTSSGSLEFLSITFVTLYLTHKLDRTRDWQD